jgi:hypothetical protein
MDGRGLHTSVLFCFVRTHKRMPYISAYQACIHFMLGTIISSTFESQGPFTPIWYPATDDVVRGTQYFITDLQSQNHNYKGNITTFLAKLHHSKCVPLPQNEENCFCGNSWNSRLVAGAVYTTSLEFQEFPQSFCHLIIAYSLSYKYVCIFNANCSSVKRYTCIILYAELLNLYVLVTLLRHPFVMTVLQVAYSNK